MQKAVVALLLSIFCQLSSAQNTAVRQVSMIHLIANPQLYDGMPILLIAFLNVEFEGNALYLHREDFEKGLLQNAVWISLPAHRISAAKKISGGYVIVQGIFSAKDQGHRGMFSGSVREVTRLDSWELGRR